MYSKVLFLCQVSRADILAQLWQYRQRRQGAMGHRPAISQQHWHASHCRMMNGFTRIPHICSCTHMTRTHSLTYTHACRNIQATLLVRSTWLWHCITDTITLRQTGVFTVALHYSEPGVGGRGNKVVFISCSLGVL